MPHHTVVVRKASHLKANFSQIVDGASKREKYLPKNPTLQTESRTKTQLTNWKQWSSIIRIVLHSKKKRVNTLAWEKLTHHHLQTEKVNHERRARTQSMSLKSWLIKLGWYGKHHILKETLAKSWMERAKGKSVFQKIQLFKLKAEPKLS